MIGVAIICAVVTSQAGGTEVDGDRFLKLMHGCMSPIHDVSLTAEGHRRYVGPADAEHDSERLEMKFQVSYAFRSDGATLLDSYIHGLSQKRPFVHETMAMLQGRLESLTRVPDVKRRDVIMVESGGPGSFNKSGSPESILYLSFFQGLRTLDERDYQFRGWDNVDGHHCLRVQMNYFRRQNKGDRVIIHFWIDMGRGGHPLKVEHHVGTKLNIRIDKILLDRYTAEDGELVWLPSAGEISRFSRGKCEFYEHPITVEEIKVVNGSVSVNAKPSDRIFTVKGRGKRLRNDPVKAGPTGIRESPRKTAAPHGSCRRQTEFRQDARRGGQAVGTA